ncbi:hypothetical protein ACOMHN_066031 [Nucella lapillus]
MPSNVTTEIIGDTEEFGSVSNYSDGDPQSGLNPWDTSDPLFSHTTRILMQRVLKCYVRQAIVFMGIPGNVLCCVVFFKQGLSDKINLLLFWLAVADLSNLVSQVLLMPGCYLTDKVQAGNWAVIGNIKIGFVSWWLGNLTGTLIVVVSGHRCLSVALPFKARRLLGYSLPSQVLLMPGCYLTDKVQAGNWAVIGNINIGFVSWWLGNLTGTLIVVVSVHRCLSVALPFKARRLLSYRSTAIAIVLSYVISLLVFLPALLVYTIRWRLDPSSSTNNNNRSIAYIVDTPWFPIERKLAIDMVYYCFVVAMPTFLGIMVVCCVITIVHLRRASRQRLKMTGNVTEEAKTGQNRITVMLLVICGAYAVLALPETVFSVIVMAVPGFHVYEKSTAIAIVLSYVISLLVFLPALLVYTIRWRLDPSSSTINNNRSIAYIVDTPWFPIERKLAIDMVYYCFVVAMPTFLGIMVVCCVITIVHLRRASRQRLKMTGNVTEEAKTGQNRITVMLLVICGAYAVLALPETVFSVIVMAVPGFHVYEKYHNTNIIVYQFIWIATCLNSTINFFVYFVLSSRFQATLKTWLLALCKSKLEVEKYVCA